MYKSYHQAQRESVIEEPTLGNPVAQKMANITIQPDYLTSVQKEEEQVQQQGHHGGDRTRVKAVYLDFDYQEHLMDYLVELK
ncbi:hypothetical protein AGDE_14496 [Angomonas deanei]|uniref:Uncharacterized protein n=1 Tax=Angomonas deanei TaxID=59799 RepID=A0A7G2CN04_9TRYP|nr:hypothetical protein AGDE_14496 [Angomonas deanei]CAD2220447.1 hypothetical protein, conserved [Angomonas deanei]|eukprot:EPY20760.1 hypothetical protein AGDE_14496 [Angomonas deanei]